jgi:predicted dehydrogenase
MRAGIIGCGWIGCGVSEYGEREDCHLQAYKKVSIEVLLCDLKDGYDYTDYKEMIRLEHLDIVSVCTPPETHADIVCAIAPYVKGIFCEKPIATTVEDADRMIEVCHKHNVVLQINHPRRFYKPKLRFSRGILDTGTHAFDLVNYLFKDNIEVDIEYIDTTGLPWEQSHIFELDCTHNDKPHVPVEAIEHLIGCIETGMQSKSSGEDARRALAQCLELQEKLKKS